MPLPRARMQRMVWVLLPAALVGCDALLGIEQLPKGSGTFGYAEADCRTCVTASCATQERACAEDASCAALYTCLSALPRDDLQGRIVCADKYPSTQKSTIAAALDTCRRASCLEPCLGTGGLITDRGENCRKCLDANAGCQKAAAACFATPECERAIAASVQCENPECLLEADYGNNAPADQLANVEACLGACDGDCGLDRDWSCVGGFEWGKSPPPVPTSVPFTININYLSLVQRVPAAGVQVDACAALPGCQVALASTHADNEGKAHLDLPLSKGRFDGHLYLHGTGSDGEAIFPEYVYFGRPITRAEDQLVSSVIREKDIPLLQKLAGNVTLDTQLGHIALVLWDCMWQEGSGATLSLDAGATTPSTAAFYAVQGATTTTHGNAGWGALNIAPGTRTVTASYGTLGVVARYTLDVQKGAITSLFLLPDIANTP